MMTKEEVLKTIEGLGFPEKEIVLPFETFFEGNNSESSIGINIPYDQPTRREFYETFKEMLDKKWVDQIFVRVADIEFPKEWFYTDTVYVISNYLIDQVKLDVEHLKPDEVHYGWMHGKPVNVGEIEETKDVISIWWD